MRKITVISILLTCFLQQNLAQLKLQRLTCEMLIDPSGIDVVKPRLGWQISGDMRGVEQVSYQVLVASSADKLNKNEADLWNSGTVKSSQSIHIIYAGKPLSSRMKCYWKVKAFTNKGEAASGENATWSMGLLNDKDWVAKWIGLDKAFPWDSVTQFSRLSARYFRKEFSTPSSVKRATAYIVGLGMYELFINGNKIGDQVLAPAPTDYRKSVLYNTHDVTQQLRAGTNAIGVTLGNGRFFTMRQDYKPKKINNFGYPKMLLQLEIEYADGKKQTIISDQSWRLTSDGPVRTNNEYDGEEYDATKELTGWNNVGYSAARWFAPEIVKAPAGKITAQMNEQMKVMQVVKPRSIKMLKPGVHILDMGQNLAGWIKMKVIGKKGQTVALRFAETLQPGGELYVANLRDAKVTDKYTLKGDGPETWEPSFIYHGFRYVEITGYPGEPTINDFEGKLVYDNVETTGTLETSNSVINQIYKNAWWGIASNYKGMPVDCPQRNERQPWLGDRTIGSLGESFMFGNANLYAKWLDDIQQAQTAEGSIPDVAPAFWNYYTDNVTWPAAYFMVADMLYKQYGDRSSITKHYPFMKKWLMYMQARFMKDYIITKDKYGDWCVPPESLEMIRSRDSMRNTNGELISTAYYYNLLQVMQRFARVIEKENDAKEFHDLGERMRSAFNQKFFNKQKKCYDNNTVTANLLPLFFGMVDNDMKDDVFDHISHRIEIADKGHISTGVIGTQFLMRGLSNFNRADIAYKIASNNSYPSWGYMAANGATTIWELWNGNTANPQMNSGNHIMLLGDLITWLYQNVAGIRSDDSLVAFKKIIMKPIMIDGLNFANASHQSLYGSISSEWKKDNGGLNWKVGVPANTTAEIHIPTQSINDVLEAGQPLSKASGIYSIRMENGHAVILAGSGQYTFSSLLNKL